MRYVVSVWFSSFYMTDGLLVIDLFLDIMWGVRFDISNGITDLS